MWTTSAERGFAFIKGFVLLGVFGLSALNLLAAIIMTIITSPGTIPEDKEWDMVSDSNTDNVTSEEEKKKIEEEK
jgi:hypothetical protein